MKRTYVLLAAGLLWLSGCSTLIPVPEAPGLTPQEAELAWGKVLSKHVDQEGRVDFRGAGKDLGHLKSYVRHVSEVDKSSLNDPRTRLAFYLNSYNALSLYNVIVADYPEDLAGFFKRAKFFAFRKFVIMKEETSLYAYENDVIRKENDPRVHVALNCMSAGCPRLPREPFTAGQLEAQLDREAKKFYNEERNVRVDHKEKVVYVSEILDFFTDDFLAKKPTLNEYINLYRKESVPLDYKVRFIPYDWTIYSQAQKKK